MKKLIFFLSGTLLLGCSIGNRPKHYRDASTKFDSELLYVSQLLPSDIGSSYYEYLGINNKFVSIYLKYSDCDSSDNMSAEQVRTYPLVRNGDYFKFSFTKGEGASEVKCICVIKNLGDSIIYVDYSSFENSRVSLNYIQQYYRCR